MATIGVLTYTLPDGLKLNKNFINKTLNQSATSATTASASASFSAAKQRQLNNNIASQFRNNKPNKLINLTNIESLGMIGTDVIVMRTKQKLTPLKDNINPASHNIENQSGLSPIADNQTAAVNQPPAKRQKMTTIKNVTVTQMPLSNIINTSNVAGKLSTTSNVTTTNITGGAGGLSNSTSKSSTIITASTIPQSPKLIKQESNGAILSQTPSTQNVSMKIKLLDSDKSNEVAKICGTNTKTNQPVTTGGRKSTPLPQAVARRNARERNRVKQVNNGFAALRQRIPEEVAEAFETSGPRGANKKLSKVETLRMAVEYIRSLERILGFEYPANMTSSAGSDGMLSPLHSDDDMLFNSTHDFVTNLSEHSPRPITPPEQLQQQHQKFLIRNGNSVIKSECSNTPSPVHQSSPENRLSSSFEEANSSLYDQDERPDYYYTDNLPDITTINGQDYLRIPGTNTYQLITPEMLENEENYHASNCNGYQSQKPIPSTKNSFVDLNEILNNSSNTQSHQQLPLPSMPFTLSMLDQQRAALQISDYSSSSDRQQHRDEPQSISPLTVSCIGDNAPALIPSPDQFSSHSSNMSGSSYATNATASHLNANFAPIMDQHIVAVDQQQPQQNERHLLQQLQMLHNQQQDQQNLPRHLLKVKIECQQQQQQNQIICGQLQSPNAPQLNALQHFDSNHNFSRAITTIVANGNTNAMHIYEAINNVINQSRCSNDEDVRRMMPANESKTIQKIKIEGCGASSSNNRNGIVDPSNLNDSSVMDAIEWWEANTPKSDQC